MRQDVDHAVECPALPCLCTQSKLDIFKAKLKEEEQLSKTVHKIKR